MFGAVALAAAFLLSQFVTAQQMPPDEGSRQGSEYMAGEGVIWTFKPVEGDAAKVPSPEELAKQKSDYLSGVALLWNGSTLEGIDRLYQQFLRGDCAHFKCEMRLAQAYRRLGNLTEAEYWARTAIEKNEAAGKNAAQEYNELGVCLYEAGLIDPIQLEGSLAALREAVAQYEGRDDTYLYNLAQALAATGRRDEAQEIFDEFAAGGGQRPVIEKGDGVIGEFKNVEVLEREQPKYTKEANEQGVQGQILLQAVIDSDGKVAETMVVRGLPHGLTEEAIKALRKSRFEPATVDGKPVAAVYSQRLEMSLRPAVLSQREIVPKKQ